MKAHAGEAPITTESGSLTGTGRAIVAAGSTITTGIGIAIVIIVADKRRKI
jgi:hypothetical protein